MFRFLRKTVQWTDVVCEADRAIMHRFLTEWDARNLGKLMLVDPPKVLECEGLVVFRNPVPGENFWVFANDAEADTDVLILDTKACDLRWGDAIVSHFVSVAPSFNAFFDLYGGVEAFYETAH